MVLIFKRKVEPGSPKDNQCNGKLYTLLEYNDAAPKGIKKQMDWENSLMALCETIEPEERVFLFESCAKINLMLNEENLNKSTKKVNKMVADINLDPICAGRFLICANIKSKFDPKQLRQFHTVIITLTCIGGKDISFHTATATDKNNQSNTNTSSASKDDMTFGKSNNTALLGERPVHPLEVAMEMLKNPQKARQEEKEVRSISTLLSQDGTGTPMKDIYCNVSHKPSTPVSSTPSLQSSEPPSQSIKSLDSLREGKKLTGSLTSSPSCSSTLLLAHSSTHLGKPLEGKDNPPTKNLKAKEIKSTSILPTKLSSHSQNQIDVSEMTDIYCNMPPPSEIMNNSLNGGPEGKRLVGSLSTPSPNSSLVDQTSMEDVYCNINISCSISFNSTQSTKPLNNKYGGVQVIGSLPSTSSINNSNISADYSPLSNIYCNVSDIRTCISTPAPVKLPSLPLDSQPSNQQMIGISARTTPSANANPHVDRSSMADIYCNIESTLAASSSHSSHILPRTDAKVHLYCNIPAAQPTSTPTSTQSKPNHIKSESSDFLPPPELKTLPAPTKVIPISCIESDSSDPIYSNMTEELYSNNRARIPESSAPTSIYSNLQEIKPTSSLPLPRPTGAPTIPPSGSIPVKSLVKLTQSDNQPRQPESFVKTNSLPLASSMPDSHSSNSPAGPSSTYIPASTAASTITMYRSSGRPTVIQMKPKSQPGSFKPMDGSHFGYTNLPSKTPMAPVVHLPPRPFKREGSIEDEVESDTPNSPVKASSVSSGTPPECAVLTQSTTPDMPGLLNEIIHLYQIGTPVEACSFFLPAMGLRKSERRAQVTQLMGHKVEGAWLLRFNAEKKLFIISI
eukprot:Ihof_evm2s736 gene=Ihof_evmTU2s736